MIWSKRWTVVFRCIACTRKFIIRNIAFDSVWALSATYPCPFCSATPTLYQSAQKRAIRSHLLIELNGDMETVYRKYPETETWHFRSECSQWPSENFIALDAEPTGEVCNECRANAYRGDENK